MFGGSYSVEIKVPIKGWVNGTMNVEREGQTFLATISAFGRSQTIPGTCQDDTFHASGRIDLPFGINSFDLSGQEHEGILSGSCKTNICRMDFRGKKISD